MENQQKLLITGANGLIGSVVSKSLADTFSIVRLDRNPIKDTSVIAVDLTDLESLRETFRNAGKITYVVHLAGNPDPGAPWEDILKDNIIATRNVFTCAMEFGIKKVVLASTTHLFGSYKGYPHTSPLKRLLLPNDPTKSDSDYGDSKGYGEILAKRHFEQHGMGAISIRIGHVTSDDKPEHPYESIWLSYKDVSQVFKKALLSEVQSGEYFAMSDNKDCMFDITPTKQDLGYKPQHSAN